MSAFSKVFIVVDALDEYPSGIRTQLLAALNEVKPTHLVITSREHIRVGEVIANYQIIPIRADECDIRAYVASRLESFRLARQIHSKPELRDDIIAAVVSNAGDL
jgi:hypothetical protein